MRRLLIVVLIMFSIGASAQVQENLIRMEAWTTPFLIKYYPKQLIRVAADSTLYALTHATLVGQTMKMVKDSGWYKVIGSRGGAIDATMFPHRADSNTQSPYGYLTLTQFIESMLGYFPKADSNTYGNAITRTYFENNLPSTDTTGWGMEKRTRALSTFAKISDTASYLLSQTRATSTYEPKITAGTTGQYWRGDKSWQTLPAPGTGTVTSISQGTGMSLSVNPITVTGTLNVDTSKVVMFTDTAVSGGKIQTKYQSRGYNSWTQVGDTVTPTSATYIRVPENGMLVFDSSARSGITSTNIYYPNPRVSIITISPNKNNMVALTATDYDGGSFCGAATGLNYRGNINTASVNVMTDTTYYGPGISSSITLETVTRTTNLPNAYHDNLLRIDSSGVLIDGYGSGDTCNLTVGGNVVSIGKVTGSNGIVGFGYGSSTYGIYGFTSTGKGVYGVANYTGSGGYFTSSRGIGVYGNSKTSFAGKFDGRLYGDTIRMSNRKAIKLSGTADSCVYFDRTDSTFKIKKLPAVGGGGTVTSVSAGTGMNFTTITTSGSVGVDTTKVVLFNDTAATGGKIASKKWVTDKGYSTTTGTVTSLTQGNGITLSTNPCTVSATIKADTSVLETKTLATSQLATKLVGSDTSNNIRKYIIDAAGDLILGTGNNAYTRLAIGTDRKFLRSNGTTAAWDTIANAATGSRGLLTSTDWNTFNGKGAGTVTNITMGYGLSSTQSPLTTTGTMKADSTVLWSTVRASHLSSYPTLNQNTTGTAGNISLAGSAGQSLRYITGAWRAWADSVKTYTATSPVDVTGTVVSLKTDTLASWARRKDTATILVSQTRHSHVSSYPTLNQNTTGSAGSVANSLTNGYGVTTLTYNGSSAKTIVADTTVLVSTVRHGHVSSYPTLNQSTTGQAGSVANALTNGYGINSLTYNGSSALSIVVDTTNYIVSKTRLSHPSAFPTLNQNTTGTAGGLSGQYIDWNASSGGTSIANKPTLTSGTVTSITMGYGLSSNQSPLTSSGTMKADSTVLVSTVRFGHLSAYPTLNQNTTGSAGSVANSLTNGYGVTTLTYNGSSAKTIVADSTVLVSFVRMGHPSAYPTLNQNTTGSSGSCSGNAATVTNGQYTTNMITNSKRSTSSTKYYNAVSSNAQLDSVAALKAPIASPTFTGTVNGITATMVGLSNVVNYLQVKIADSNKTAAGNYVTRKRFDSVELLQVYKSEILTLAAGGFDSTEQITTGFNKAIMGYSSGFVVDSLIFMPVGAAVNLVIKVWYGSSINAAGTAVVTAGTTVNSVTGVTRVSSFDQATIAKGYSIWATVSTSTTKCRKVAIIIKGHRS